MVAAGAELWHKGTMETGLDLDQASRETLLAVIAEQQGVISELRRRVENLEARLSGGGPGSRMPGHKPAARRKKAAREEKKPRRKRPHGFARPRMEPTRQVVHAPEFCPECHTALSGGWVQRTREVIELPVSPAEVTEHVCIARTCPRCRKRRLPQAPLRGVAAGRQRLGINLVSLIAALREEGRLPMRTIQWYLQTAHQLKLSVGAIAGVVHQAAQQARPAVAEALERIRASPVVHADETGWRENGVNGYVWTFSTSTERYFRGPGRGGGGRGPGRVLRRDSGERLLCCLPPLPRLETAVLGPSVAGHPQTEGAVPRRRRSCPVGPEGATALRQGPEMAAAGGRPPHRGQLALERRLLALCRPFLEDPLAVQGKLCRRIERHIKELFVFVSHPETPSDNNAAERSLRHLVVSRKISGGTRSQQGSDSKMTLASLFGTWTGPGPQSPPSKSPGYSFPHNSEQLRTFGCRWLCRRVSWDSRV